MRATGWMWALLFLGGAAQAAPPVESHEVRLEAVNVPGREIVVHGETWPLSSTVEIQVPGNPRASLRDVTAGMNVWLEVAFADADAEIPVVRRITVLPD